MIEIKDTRKTATKDPRVKVGQVVRIDKHYYLCCKLDNGLLSLFDLSDGLTAFEDRNDDNDGFFFLDSEVINYDIEVITNKITLTIE